MAGLVKDSPNTSTKQRGLTVTTARKSITSGCLVSQLVSTTPKRVQPRLEDKPDLVSSKSTGSRQQARKEALPTVSSVSPEAVPGLRRQALSLDPGQAKQREKGWGLSFKEPTVALLTRKEVGLHCSASLSRMHVLYLCYEQGHVHTAPVPQHAAASNEHACCLLPVRFRV